MRTSSNRDLVLFMACFCLFALSIQLRSSEAQAFSRGAHMSFSFPSFPHASNDAAKNDAATADAAKNDAAKNAAALSLALAVEP